MCNTTSACLACFVVVCANVRVHLFVCVLLHRRRVRACQGDITLAALHVILTLVMCFAKFIDRMVPEMSCLCVEG